MPSFVELLERLVALEKVVAERDVRLKALEVENAELRRRLGQTPRNSNMPPSAQPRHHHQRTPGCPSTMDGPDGNDDGNGAAPPRPRRPVVTQRLCRHPAQLARQ